MKKGSGWKQFLFLGMLLWLMVPSLLVTIRERSHVSRLKADSCYGEAFRRQELRPRLYETVRKLGTSDERLGDALTVSMLEGDFRPDRISLEKEPYIKYKPEEYTLLRSCYEAVWADLNYFPIPDDGIIFEDTWLSERSYGGKRQHEGTDLFGRIKEPGYYPILSITDGVVEQIGWLPLGGYRIGIRSLHGGYFYYAHLSEYEREFVIGDPVSAGDILGYMGNTGYGEEGTAGRFPVHLHLGIYIRTPEYEELSVNPYWILKALEKNIRKYTYS